jgi:hypothetical protein
MSFDCCADCARTFAALGLVAVGCIHHFAVADQPPHVPEEPLHEAIVAPVVSAITTGFVAKNDVDTWSVTANLASPFMLRYTGT